VGQEWGKTVIKEKGVLDKSHNPLILLARLAGFEPAAYGLEVCPKLKTV